MGPQSFATALLRTLNIQPTPENVRAVVGWEKAEGGHWNNSARYNPLNTTQPEPGAGNTGSQGNIKVYTSWDQGVKATADTLRNGRYGGILAALRQGRSAGAVADAVGRSPWGTSAGLIHRVIGSTPAPAQVPTGAPAGTTTTTTRTTPGVNNSAERQALLLQFAQQGAARNPMAVTALAQQLPGAQDTPGRTVTTTSRQPAAPSPAGHGGLVQFDGKPVAAWIKPLLDFARQNGWKGTVTSGYRSDAEQTRIYNSGVRPAAVPKSLGGAGSNHERTGFLQGAVDVTDAATLDRILRAKHSRLQYAGAKDPVHFSVPRNGSY